MQWFKGAVVVMSAFAVAALANGCSSKGGGTSDAGDGGLVPSDAKPDKANTDGSGNCTPTSGLSCEQCDVTGFTATGQATPEGPHMSGACSAGDITAFDTACLSTSSDQTSCFAWQNAEADAGPNCLNCIYTFQTGATWGPFVCDNQSGQCTINIPGCVDLALGQTGQENSTSTGSCGDLLNASYECQDYACGSCNVAADGGSDSASFDQCLGTNSNTDGALNNECKSFADAFDSASQCAALTGDAGLTGDLAGCFPADANTGYTEQELTNFVNYFCGPAN